MASSARQFGQPDHSLANLEKCTPTTKNNSELHGNITTHHLLINPLIKQHGSKVGTMEINYGNSYTSPIQTE